MKPTKESNSQLSALTIYDSALVAWGTLEAARAIVREIERATATFPVDADPRASGLFAGRTLAQGPLEIAKELLRSIENAVKHFPVDADPRIASLFVAQKSAWLLMEGAEEVLEGVKISVGSIAEVGIHIAKFGLGGLLDIKRARFETALSTVAGGSVDLELDLSFMERAPETVKLSFSFRNPLDGAKRLADNLLN